MSESMADAVMTLLAFAGGLAAMSFGLFFLLLLILAIRRWEKDR